MAKTVGRFDASSPKITFTIGGSKAQLEFEGTLDTGFTGFMLLPIALAVPLGLELDGLNTSLTADGTVHRSPTATAHVEFGTDSRDVSIVLAYYGDEILLGMNFLETFQQSLIIHRDKVMLMDSAELDATLPGLH